MCDLSDLEHSIVLCISHDSNMILIIILFIIVITSLYCYVCGNCSVYGNVKRVIIGLPYESIFIKIKTNYHKDLKS